MFEIKKKFCLSIVFVISLIAIISAYFIEYALGYQPCNLCIIERIPYAVSIFLILLNYKLKLNEKLLILLLLFIFTFSLFISVYHLGIEKNFFNESFLCNAKNAADLLSKEEILLELQKITISCKDVTFRVFGLSLTSINIFVSLLITIMLIKVYTKNEKNKS